MHNMNPDQNVSPFFRSLTRVHSVFFCDKKMSRVHLIYPAVDKLATFSGQKILAR